MELLEYLIQVRGGAAAGAQVRGLSAEMNKLAVSQERVGASGDAAAAGSEKMAASMGLVGKVAKVGALGLAAIGLEAVKMSTKFNHEMLRIRTDAGASTKELANMKTGVLDLASSGRSMGQGPMSLAAGLYHLESLGIRGKSALKALALSSQEAAISGANLEQTTTAMGAAMYVGIKGTGNLTKLMGTLNATVGAGNMRFQDLVEALGTGVLPSAKVAGLSLQDVSAALAVATDSGYKASSAAAQLGTAFHFLYAPTSKATTALASIHLSHNALASDMHKPQGLLVALTDLKSHLSRLSSVAKAQVLNAILPGGRGRILLTELTMLDRLKGKYTQINKTAGGFTGSVAQQRKDPQTQLKTAEAGAQASMIRLGDVLTPIVLPALTAILKVGSQVVTWLQGATKWLTKHKDAATALGIGLVALAGGFLAVKVALIASRVAMLGSPIGWLIIGISLLVAAVVYAWKHFKTFRDVVKTAWKDIQIAAAWAWSNVLKPAFAAIKAGVIWLAGAFSWLWKNVIKPVWGAIEAVVSSAWNAFLKPIFTAIKDATSWLGGAFNWLWKNVITPVWTGISADVTKAWGIIQPILSTLGDAFKIAFGIVKDVVNAVLAPINAVAGALNQVGSAVNSINPFSGSSSQAQINKGTPAQVQALNNKLKQVGMPQVHQHALFILV